MANQKPKVKVTINGKQQRQNSNHNGQKHYGDEVKVEQTNHYLVMNPLATNYHMHQEIHAVEGKNVYATQSITNGNAHQYAVITD